jgi:thioredoxin-like negative regulator of GroEL
MIERLLIAVVLIGLGVVAYLLITRWQSARAAAALPLLDGHVPGTPLIVYFTSPTCITCKTVQQPVLHLLQGEFNVQVITIDALVQMELADQFGVMTVPTTLVFDGKSRPVAQNFGLAHADKLRKQLTTAAAA